MTEPLFSPSRCACGCGSLTVLRGNRFLHGHNRRFLSAPIALLVNRNGGYCECGCGTLAPIARQSQTARGNVRGLAMRFAPSHSSRVRTASPLPIFVDETDVDWGVGSRGFTDDPDLLHTFRSELARRRGQFEFATPRHSLADRVGAV